VIIDDALRYDGLLAGLRGEGMAVCDRFLAASEVDALANCARTRRQRGGFAAARIGADRMLQRREEIRGDATCWLSEPLFEPERELLVLLEDLRLRLNRAALLGLFELELHYAWYPPGAGYARHVDQLQRRGERRVSMALYLNDRWAESDGGALRLFGDDGRFRDIEPEGGRLVIFLTERREHAVMPTRRPRLSLTGWYRGREAMPLR